MNKMDKSGRKETPGTRSRGTFADLYAHVETRDLSQRTRRGYLRHLKRAAKLYNVNRLDDIPVDIDAFVARWTDRAYPAAQFANINAYRRWRGVVHTIMREHAGLIALETERRTREDDWQVVLDRMVSVCGSHPNLHVCTLALRYLIDRARASDVQPATLTATTLTLMGQSAPPTRRRTLQSAYKRLAALRLASEEVRLMMPDFPAEFEGFRYRAVAAELPEDLSRLIEARTQAYCAGVVDFVTGEPEEPLSASRAYHIRAALRKIAVSALACGAIDPDCRDLGQLVTPPVLRAVVGEWVANDDPTSAISERTMCAYIRAAGAVLGDDLAVEDTIKRLLKSSVLREGLAAEHRMSDQARVFCGRLITDRHAELLFRSLHVRFHRRSLEMREAGDITRANQLGILACVMAIGLWGVPLRISNLLSLRLYGDGPTIVMPSGTQKSIRLRVDPTRAKNKREILAEIRPGRDRAIEIVQWYVRSVRPLLPSAQNSEMLFPGRMDGHISVSGLRDWLYEHSAQLGMPMTPHNLRHGQASLYLKHHPGDYAAAAQLLGDREGTVRKFYAWIDQRAELDRVQQLIAQSAGLVR